MEKLDLKKQLKHLYSASASSVNCVDVPPLPYLLIDGQGDPNTSPLYKDAVEALFSISYTLKFMLKKGETAIDYTVMPLEGLWWMEGGKPPISADGRLIYQENKDAWHWTMMIMQPDFITPELFEEARKSVSKKKSLSTLAEVRFERFHEGPVVQILHIGPYADELPTLQKLYSFMTTQGYGHRGKHHEIYLSDPKRTAPARLQTLIRQPYQ